MPPTEKANPAVFAMLPENPQKFAEMVGDAAEVKIHDWYAEG